MKRYLLHFLALIAILLMAFAPLLAAAGAGYFAEWNGCRLHEGFQNPCLVGGIDVGSTLYTVIVLGWFAFATIPFGGFLLIVWLVWVLITLIKNSRTP